MVLYPKGGSAVKGILFYVYHPNQGSYWLDGAYRGIVSEARCGCDVMRELPVSGGLDGAPVILLGGSAEAAESVRQRGGRPILADAAKPLGLYGVSSVTFELEESIRLCLDRLTDAGRQRIALLGLNPNGGDAVKLRAFPEKKDVFAAKESLTECVEAFVKERARDYDAVICANDTTAIRLLAELDRFGIRTPDELWVIGMGNSLLGAALPTPLTSVSFDYTELGRASVRLCRALVREPVDVTVSFCLPCSLAVRATAPLSDRSMAPKPNAPKPRPPYRGGGRRYFDGAEPILLIESILEGSDAIDRELLLLLAEGAGCETIAERLYLTDRAVRYRISKLIAKYGLPHRAALEAALRAALPKRKE